MQNEIWQRLTRLESHDLVASLFSDLHGRKLNSTRISEIRSAARQSREYFRQASTANQAVRPLLTFYGVASLSRSLTLLLRRDGGENTLHKGHGLETSNWSATLTSDVAKSLTQIDSLKIRTCGGLFADLITDTKNRICMHMNSSAVDWHIKYDPLPSGYEIGVGELLERLPDLKSELSQANAPIRFVSIGEMSFNSEVGFSGILSGAIPLDLRNSYEASGYSFEQKGQREQITASVARFSAATAQFSHSYVKKMFESIPILHIVEAFAGGRCISQIGTTYLLSYVLGMLARYYPTHWIALIDGGEGDRLWPALNRAQQYVESVYPELVLEFIEEAITNPLPHSKKQ